MILNVTNISNITLLDKYVDHNAIALPPVSNPDITSNPEMASRTKLSSGATIGISVGATAAVSSI
jgi:hypothetical protein